MGKKQIIFNIGSSVSSAKVSEVKKANGSTVKAGEPIIAIETDKVNIDIDSGYTGIVSNLNLKVGSIVNEGDLICEVDERELGGLELQDVNEKTDRASFENKNESPVKIDNLSETETGKENCDCYVGNDNNCECFIEKKMTPSEFIASGSKDHSVNVCNCGDPKCKCEKTNFNTTESGCEYSSIDNSNKKESINNFNIDGSYELSGIRKAIADNLLQTAKNKVIVTTFNEVDMTEILKIKSTVQDTFIAKHGVKLGIVSFFVKSLCLALQSYPEMINYIENNRVIVPKATNVGVAMDSGKGLFVPVIKKADKMSIADIEIKIKSLVNKTQESSLNLEDVTGGCISVTNGGVFGSSFSTPVLNGNESVILGLHKIKESPYVINKEIVIRPIMNIALSYDHRLIDGRQAILFLNKIKEIAETPAEILFDI